MAEYSSILLEKAVDELAKLPGIGRKTALRLALHLLGEEKTTTEMLTQALSNMRKNIVLCRHCYNISDSDICSICSNPKRDNGLLCVVADMRDVMAIERTSSFNGVYHVLGGVIDPINGVSPNDLKIKELVERSIREEFREIILALPATIEGDTTNYYIFKMLKHFKGDITVIAKGISVGDALEFADEVTLGRSITNRVPFN
ncbi:MAG: recombination protein RecR [bacterium]|nr:recombination protein RecR [Candidatus Limimorpha caballi]MCQ2316648.1 recombination mediator RecR [Bacteroidales bacterium]